MPEDASERVGAGTPAGAPPGGAAAGGQPAGGVPAGGEPAGGEPSDRGADPFAAALPEAYREALGAETFGDLRERLSAAEQQTELLQVQREVIAALQLIPGGGAIAAAGVAGGAAPGAKPPGWYGYGSKEAYIAAYQADPEGTEVRKFEWLAKHHGQGAFKPVLDAALAPERERAQDSAVRSADEWIQQKYGLSPKTHAMVFDAMNRFTAGNPALVEALVGTNPRLLAEVAYKATQFDRLAGELKALKARHGEIAGSPAAGAARSGISAPGQSGPPKTRGEAVRQRFAQLRAAGQQFSKEVEDAAVAAVERQLAS
jgi:hypothetical protein